MQKIQIIIAEVLLYNILNAWFQKHFIHASFFRPWFKKSADLSKNYDIWPKMLSSFDAGQSEVSLCKIWLRLNKK